MSWFIGVCPTREEMRNHRKSFLDASYQTKKHILRTQQILRGFWLDSKRRRNGDVWAVLHDYSEVSSRGVIKGAGIKAAIRLFLFSVQDGKCCYCKRPLFRNAYASPIEHILSRSSHPYYSVEFWNLAIACVDCNQLKRDSEWQVFKSKLRAYPRPYAFTKIFHPRFHRFEDHVRYARIDVNNRDLVIYTGKTDQGRNLCENLLSKIVARDIVVADNSVFGSTLALLKSNASSGSSDLVEGFSQFQEALNNAIFRELDV